MWLKLLVLKFSCKCSNLNLALPCFDELRPIPNKSVEINNLELDFSVIIDLPDSKIKNNTRTKIEND